MIHFSFILQSINKRLLLTSREFLWANSTTKGQTQFEAQSHLKLNWANTLRFQAEGQTKFKKIKELSEKISEAGMGTQVKHQLRTQYLNLKENDTILYNSSYESQKIKINSYIQWLKDNGYAIGTSTNLSVD